MKFGIMLLGSGKTPPELLAAAARAVEERGFAAIWVPEHVVFFKDYASPYPYSNDGKLHGFDSGTMEPWTLLTFMAAHTSKVRLGSAVCLLPQRNPVYTAKQIADLDFLSGGRVNVGLGMGWLEEEFKTLGVPFARRGARGRDYVKVMKALWTQDEARFDGEFHSLNGAMLNPKPVQKPHPPILFGGEGEAALRRVAQLGDGWMGANMTPEEMAPKLARLDELLADQGRTRADIKLYTLPNRPPDADMYPRYAELGVEQVLHFLPLKDADDFARRLDKLAALRG